MNKARGMAQMSAQFLKVAADFEDAGNLSGK